MGLPEQKDAEGGEEELPVSKLSAVQARVDEVKAAMVNNIELVLQRGDDLDRLNGESENLNHVANSFKKTAVKVKKQQRWQKYKCMCLCITLALLAFSGIVCAIVLPIALH